MNLRFAGLRLSQGAFKLELDLEINSEVIGIFGSSGAGKTSLLEVVAGLRNPIAGTVSVDGLVMIDAHRKVFLAPDRRNIGYVPQDLALFPHLSVRENLLYGHDAEARSAGIDFSHVADILEIGPLLDRHPAALSGGQKQRVAFARALLAMPCLLLLDEPLTGLDQELKSKLLPYLKRIRDEFKIPMIYVSHSPDELAELCDQVLVLRDGRCLQIGSPEHLFEAATSRVLKAGIYGDS